jgi:hypothetical protein
VTTTACSDALAPDIAFVVSEPVVHFQAIRGSTTPLSQTVTVTNGGDGKLGTITCPAAPAPWLACVVNKTTVTLTANPTGLTTNQQTISVPITATGAGNREQSVLVDLVIDQPILTLNASALAFGATAGSAGTTPASATVTVTNSGVGTLVDLGTPLTCTPTPANTRVTCAVNATTGQLTIAVDAGGLATGTYVFPLTVASPNQGNSAQSVTAVLTVTAPPRIAVSQPFVHFQAIRGSLTPLTQTVIVSNGGNGSLGTVSCPANPATWLTCAVAGGTTLTFTAQPALLTASQPPVSVTVSATGAATTLSLPVDITIDQPILRLSETALSFSAVPGATVTTPTSVTITATNAGAGTLGNLGAITCAPTPVGAPVTCQVSQATGTLTVTVDPSGLAPNTYFYGVTIAAPNAGNGAQTASVTLAIVSPPAMLLSQYVLHFQAIRGSTTPQTQTVTVLNGGVGNLGVIACPQVPAPWLSCTVLNNTLTFVANPTGLIATPLPVTLSVTASGAFNSPQFETVDLTIDQPFLSVSATTASFTATAPATTTAPASIAIVVTNSGAGTLANLGAITCTPVPASPRVGCGVNQLTGVLTLTVDPTGLAAGTYLFFVAVSAPNQNNPAPTIALILTIS